MISSNLTFQRYITCLMGSEKYCLKWNDFQVNVSKTFSSLKKEKDFFDVTLVSDDEEHISAHKVVLSASSEFFKNILKKANHINPMIYLSGVNSKELYSVMDYIYLGEVNLFQNDLNSFLETSQRLKIDGLVGGTEDQSKEEDLQYKEEREIQVQDFDDSLMATQKTIIRNNHSREIAINASNIDAKAAVNQLVKKIENNRFQCRTCGKSSFGKNSSSEIRRHVEIHIEGLSFECKVCKQSFRSRNLLSQHKVRHNFKV